MIPAAVVALVVAVMASVDHAEVLAHRMGEPLGTLVLALAVTIIETALVQWLMLAGGPQTAALRRATINAAVMIINNGVIGSGSGRCDRPGLGPRRPDARRHCPVAVCGLPDPGALTARLSAGAPSAPRRPRWLRAALSAVGPHR